jgi:aminomethyltransferase
VFGLATAPSSAARRSGRELIEGTSRWAAVGIVVEWDAWDRLYRNAGLLPPKSEHPWPYEAMLYDRDGNNAGYCTSFVYSPVLQRHIGLARVRPDQAEPGTEVHLELAINHHNTTVDARTTKLPFFNPARKTAKA